MKLTIPVNSLRSTQSGFGTKGGKLTSALILVRDPQNNLEAVTKRYIDSLFLSIDSSNVGMGIIPAERFPRFIGDVSKAEGSNILELSSKNLAIANYCKVNIDSSGRINSGASLTVDDIPSLSWNKVKADAPSTVANYGITDALTKAGGALTGYLNLSLSPVQTLHAVNKQYADNSTSGDVGAVVGDINIKGSTTTPVGYLRCNGGEVSKTTYSALYSILGDKYSIVYNPGYGKPWTQQYDINTGMTGGMPAFNGGGYLPTSLKDYQAVVTKNKVYILGGHTGSSASSYVYSSDVDGSGNLIGINVNGVKKQVGVASGSVTVPKKTLQLRLTGIGDSGTVTKKADQISYIWNSWTPVGDWYTGPGGNFVDDSMFTLFGYNMVISRDPTSEHEEFFTTLSSVAYLDANGVLLPRNTPYNNSYTVSNDRYLLDIKISAGIKLTPVYDYTTGDSSYLIINGNYYYFPGSYGDYPVNVTSFTINLPVPYNNSDMVLTSHASSQGFITLEYDDVAANQASGKFLPSEISAFQAITIKNKVYVIGGFNGINSVSSIFSAAINTDGTLGTWTTEPLTLPEGLRSFNAFYDGNFVYLIGGYTTVPVSKIYRSTVDPVTGSLGVFNLIGNLPDNIYEASMAVLKETVYILGGRNDAGIVNSVYKAKISLSGELTTWFKDGDLPDFLASSNTYVTKNSVYLIGGINKTGNSYKTYSALIDSNDNLSTWTLNTTINNATNNTQDQGKVFAVANSLYFTAIDATANTSRSYLYRSNINGGLNDYSPYYSGTLKITNPANFRLPDYSSREAFGIYYYVKY